MRQVRHKQVSSALRPTPGSRDLPRFMKYSLYEDGETPLSSTPSHMQTSSRNCVFPYSLEGLINLGTHTVTNKICFYTESHVDMCA